MNVLITGASQGIGYETAKALAAYPEVKRIVVIARSADRLKALQHECRHTNCEIIPFLYDITSLLDNDSIVNDLLSLVSELSIVINNAGFLINKPFEKCSYEDAKLQFDTNFFAPALLIQALLPLLQNNGAHVVNIGSMGGFQGSSKFGGLAFYSASKAALACLTECLAVELAPYNIKINCLALGAVQTEMLSQAFPNYTAPLTAVQMGKHIAQFALFGSNTINGQVIPVTLSNP